MKFTFKEWQVIRHALEVAEREYIKTRDEATPRDDELSIYQIFNRQAIELQGFISRIDNAEL